MIPKLQWLNRRPSFVIMAGCLVLVLLIGLVDYETGREISMKVLYFAPIAVATWFVGWRAGVMAACASVVIWLVANTFDAITNGHLFVLTWNAVTLGAEFAIVVWLLNANKGKTARLENDVASRTEKLRAEIAERESLQAALRAMVNEVLMVEERERCRLAMDLHDGLGQILSLARMKVDGSRESLGKMNSGAPEEINGLLEQALHVTRNLTYELSPPMLHTLGILPAAKWLADDINQRYGLNVSVLDDGGPESSLGGIDLVLFRCLRELLINVAKHAHASQAIVRLRYENNTMRVVVEDNGAGFDPDNALGKILENPDQGGFGLFSIRERLQHLGGRMEIQAAQGQGSIVTLAVPASSSIPDYSQMEETA